MDLGIVVDHIAPGTIGEFWKIRKGRGRGGPQVRRFLQGWSIGRITAWAVLRIIKSSIILSLVVPPFVMTWRATRFSFRGKSDLFPFFGAWFIELLAFHVGEWQSVLEIMIAERSHL